MVGQICEYDEREGIITIQVLDYYDANFLLNNASTDCEVILQDARSITPRQNRAIHAMIRDIATYISGYGEKDTVRSETLNLLQYAYLLDTESNEEIRYALTNRFCELQGIELFSLSAKNKNCASVTLARNFLTWLIDFAIENGIPCSGRLIDRAEDVGRYLYACLANKTCCVCGKPNSELHHVDTVGSGRNRKEIAHIGMLAECLCREHHAEVGNIGQKTFDDKYKVYGIELDKVLCEKYKLKVNK